MKNILLKLVVLVMAIALVSCGSKNQPVLDVKDVPVSFEAYIKEGETFTFEFDPSEEPSYEDLRDDEITVSLSKENWDTFFDLKEVYREHYEYDDAGNRTETYMKGSFYSVTLKDDFYFVDNRSRNGLEFDVYVDGEETRTMINNGKTYDPITTYYNETKQYYGADSMIVFTDFVNSWDESTREEYTGKLNSYEMKSASGDLVLLNASSVRFKKYNDECFYFAVYDSSDEYFVILIRTDDPVIDREKDYEGAVYSTSGYRVNERYTGYDRFTVWEMITELMKKVNS